MIDNITLNSIREVVKTFEDEKRFFHTLGVEEEAQRLGEIFMPEKIYKLRLAALLHDITKGFTQEKQIALCEEYNIELDPNDLAPKLFHAKTGCEYARKLFGEEIVDKEVYDAILYHTTGRENMTLFEQLIYLADYIEPNRTFEDCIILRKYFYENIEKAKSEEEKIKVLNSTMIMSFDLTLKNLSEEGKKIDLQTIKARNYFISLIKK
jgi:nicotinate-nucleotide adenylyltransferase